MKLKENFVFHQVGEKTVLVSADASVFPGLLKLNETAAFVCRKLISETTREALVSEILENYDTDEKTAGKAVDGIIGNLKKIGALSE